MYRYQLFHSGLPVRKFVLKLDTMTGQIWMIYHNNEVVETTVIVPSINCDGNMNGRFSMCYWEGCQITCIIYETSLLLLDQSDGRCWLVLIQYNSELKNWNTKVNRIS